jgi:hypothetical protein
MGSTFCLLPPAGQALSIWRLRDHKTVRRSQTGCLNQIVPPFHYKGSGCYYHFQINYYAGQRHNIHLQLLINSKALLFTQGFVLGSVD